MSRPMRPYVPLALAACLFAAAPAAWAAAPGGSPTTVRRGFAFDVTVDRLVKAIESRGAGIAATVDHAKAAASADLELRPTTVVIFGSPKLGTPLMQNSQTAGLDLPLRVLVWQGEDGAVNLGYWPPALTASLHGADAGSEAVERMGKAIGGIVAEAAGRE